MCQTYDKRKGRDTRELQSRMVPPPPKKKLGRVTLSATLGHYYTQYYFSVTDFLADKIGERTKFDFVQQ